MYTVKSKWGKKCNLYNIARIWMKNNLCTYEFFIRCPTLKLCAKPVHLGNLLLKPLTSLGKYLFLS